MPAPAVGIYEKKMEDAINGQEDEESKEKWGKRRNCVGCEVWGEKVEVEGKKISEERYLT